VNSEVRKVVLDDPPNNRGGSPPAWLGHASWFVGPLLLGAVLLGVYLLRQGSEALFTGILAVVAGVPILWLLVSVFAPAKADRTCPDCGASSVAPASEDRATGLRCRRCGWSDASASAWKHAEEGDRPLEPLVLRERSGSTTPDSSPPA